MTRVAAIDHGTRRIGVAVGDLETGMAFARAAIRQRRDMAPEDAVAETLRSDGVSSVVVGLPVHADGEEGTQAGVVRDFGDRLRERGFDVVYWDERNTSWQAARELGQGAQPDRRARAGGELDSAAARIILQDYLDTQRRRSAQQEESE